MRVLSRVSRGIGSETITDRNLTTVNACEQGMITEYEGANTLNTV